MLLWGCRRNFPAAAPFLGAENRCCSKCSEIVLFNAWPVQSRRPAATGSTRAKNTLCSAPRRGVLPVSLPETDNPVSVLLRIPRSLAVLLFALLRSREHLPRRNELQPPPSKRHVDGRAAQERPDSAGKRCTGAWLVLQGQKHGRAPLIREHHGLRTVAVRPAPEMTQLVVAEAEQGRAERFRCHLFFEAHRPVVDGSRHEVDAPKLAVSSNRRSPTPWSLHQFAFKVEARFRFFASCATH